MQLDLGGVNAVIFVFAMPDCPACHDHIPVVVQRARARAREGFVVCDGACPVVPGQIPVLIYDVNSDDPVLREILTNHAITMTPTTLLLARQPGSCKVEGSMTPGQIDHMFDMARALAR